MMNIAPDGVEIERMIRLALEDAQLTPNEIDYVNAHGTGTQLNDMTEAMVIERVFGRDVLVNSTKSQSRALITSTMRCSQHMNCFAISTLDHSVVPSSA